MRTIRDLQRHKQELLERYEAARLAELLDELRPEAAHQAEDERFPWKGEFRPRPEIEYLYGQRKIWDRRFLLDMVVLIAVLGGLTYGAKWGVRLVSPMPPEGRPAAAAAAE
jgi:hypothetical protein